MTTSLIIGGILCGWALLNLLGGERQRRLVKIQADCAAAAAQAERARKQQQDATRAAGQVQPPDPHKSVR